MKQEEQMNDTMLLHPLPVVVPPMLEAAMGYADDARLVAFFFDVGDEAYVADGYITFIGEWDAYELFVNHPLVAPHLRSYDLGSSEESPTHYLLLDRQARTLSIAPVALAQRLLREQWGGTAESTAMCVVSEEEWDHLLPDLMSRLVQTVPLALAEDQREHQRLVEALAAWLAHAWEGTL